MASNKFQLKQKLKPTITPKLFADCNLLFLPLGDLTDACNELLCDDPFVHIAPPLWQVRHIEDMNENDLDRFTSAHNEEESLRRQLALITALEPAVALLSYDFWLSILDSRGYLTDSTQEIARQGGVPHALFEKALLAIRKNIEPTGLFAGDLRESFLLQLQNLGLEASLAWMILSEGHESLASGRIQAFLDERRITQEAYDTAILTLRSLDPAPGRYVRQTQYAVPEVEFFAGKGKEVRVRLMRENLPRVESALAEYRDHAYENGRHFLITPNVREALKRLGMRYKTLFRLASFLAEHQRDFLMQETDTPNPLVLKEAASACGLSISTIHRIALHTWGSAMGTTVHLKSLFSRPALSNGISLAALKKEIVRLNALACNDREIADLLHMPQRTVRWHRKRLGLIPVRKHSRL